ncbi:amino acid adenylation domain-containing protein [Micromonospora zingiberis]|uniref:Amino acid adenylation domain-containing protein n=1 Tax=Micromonospora zingiberis TaxID=2053011 RepID=A0A4R0GIC4_9ACTN|nr:amino acid adenylation domain-containing protein [Micromonospora zingiberis]
MWLLEQLAPYRGVHRLVRTWHLDGTVDALALRSAWRTLLDRHEALRTRLIEVDGAPVPLVSTDTESAFVHVDLGHLADAERTRAADRVCVAAASVPERATDTPLARLTLVRIGPTTHRLVLALHRTVADDRSISIIADELSICYAAAVRPDADGPALAPVLRYAEYARWQRDLVDGPAGRRLLDWWTRELTPLPPSVPLPTDHDGAARPAGPAGLLSFDWGTALADRLATYCRTRPANPAAVLLAAVQAVLHRYGDDDQVTVVMPVPVPPPGFPALVGPCDNLLVLTGDLGGAPTFDEAVDRAAAVLRAATAHRDLPFARLVQELPVDRDPGRVPFCDVLLAVPGPEAELRLTGATVAPTAVTDAGPTVADLAITVRRTWPSLAGTLGYRADRFASTSAEGLLGQVRTLLSAALDAPHTPLHRLPLDVAAVAGAIDEDPSVEPLTVHEIVRRHAVRTPDAVAVAGPDGRWTYRELDRRAEAVAEYLRGLPVDGAPVAVRMTPGPWQLAASLGILRAGGHLVWFGTGDAGQRGQAILAELRPVCLLRSGEDPDDDLARWYRDELDGRLVDVTCLPRPPAKPVPAPTDDLSRTAYVAYTSGSTGRPKGIAHTHRAFAQFVTWMADALELAPGARVAQWVTPEHDPSLCETFATLVGGGTLHPVPVRIRVHPEKLADWLVRERVTFLQTVPSFAREVLAVVAAREPADRPTGLRRLVLMGETLSDQLVNGFRRVLPATRLANIYGPTETIAATWHDITGPVPANVPIGRPIPGRQVLVLDEADQPCPTGVTGELVVRSRYVCDGYLGDGAGRQAAFRAPAGGPDDDSDLRWYRTGDLARRRWDGALEFRGRRDHQVKLLGTRVELADVEAALAAHDGVADCAVVPVTDQDGLVVRLTAYVVPRRGPDGDPLAGAAQWRAQLRRRFGGAMVLVAFETVPDQLPRTVAGKVDRRRLPAPRSASARRATGNPVEEGLAEIWSALLGTGPYDAEVSFFGAGGHSLLVPVLVQRIRRRFGVTVPLRECFTHNTLAGMAALVEAERTAHDRSVPADSADLRAVTDAME